MERVNILGVGVSAINMEMALFRIDGWIERREPNYVIAVPAHCIARASAEKYSIENMVANFRSGIRRAMGSQPWARKPHKELLIRSE
jgi:UDP-N-acetyl-D-mannosaminuronic acid transferase (WecB/TagA/CpsF family)